MLIHLALPEPATPYITEPGDAGTPRHRQTKHF